MKRMLINATHAEELRVAIVDGQRLQDLDIENKTRQQKKSNIYKAKITRIEPSLEAAFVDYGADRHGFLPFKEIAREYLDEKAFSEGGRPNVKDGIKEGDEIIVQIEKEERGNKGAALTTFISLAGRFLVLMPNNPRAGGVSRRIEGEDRANLRAAMNDVNVPEEMGTIVRTAGIGRTTEELQWDLDYQIEIWKAINRAAEDKKAPFLIYQESNVIVRALRDNFRSDIGEILIDEPDVHGQAEEFITRYMPHNTKKLKLYQEDIPLFSRYQIESQIESAFQREVQLPSGGAIVLDHTEALISIDINSARATKGSDIEETATSTNLEACDEIARQLRLRDNGGLIVIDFIDMLANKNQRKVEARLREVMKADRARVQIGRISRFGLMEMSRQRLRPSLGESSQSVCPRCLGHGTIRGVESLSLSILRLLEEEAMKDNTGRVMVQVPVDVSAYLVNEKRENIAEIENRTQVQLLIVPSPGLETPHFRLERIRNNDQEHESEGKKSYELSINLDEPYIPGQTDELKPVGEQPAVTRVVPDQPAPQPSINRISANGPAKEATVVNKIIGAFSSLFSSDAKEKEKQQESTEEKTKQTRSTAQQKRSNRSNNQSGTQAKGSNRRRGKSQKKPSKSTDSAQIEDQSKRNGKQEKSSEDSANKEKRTRSRNTKRGPQGKKTTQEKKSYNKDKSSVESKSDSAILDSDEEAQIPENRQEKTGDKPNRNRRQRQGSNYNRSRRQTSRDDNDETTVTDAPEKPQSTDPVSTEPDQAVTNAESEATSKADNGQSTQTSEQSSVKSSSTSSDTIAASSANEEETTNGKSSMVSSKQPSQLKSSVRSLANKPSATEEPQSSSTQKSETQSDSATSTDSDKSEVKSGGKSKSRATRSRGRPAKTQSSETAAEVVEMKNDTTSAADNQIPETRSKQAAPVAAPDTDASSSFETSQTSKSVARDDNVEKSTESAHTEKSTEVNNTPPDTPAKKPAAPRSSWGSPKPTQTSAEKPKQQKQSATAATDKQKATASATATATAIVADADAPVTDIKAASAANKEGVAAKEEVIAKAEVSD